MFGKGMEDMLKTMLGVDPEEIKSQVSQAVIEAKVQIEAHNNHMNYQTHKLIRIEKMLECIMRDRQLTLEEDNDGSRKLTGTDG